MTVVSVTPHPAIARIIVTEKDGVSFGTGALVETRGDVGLVLTNWHVVRDAVGDVLVHFPEGHRAAARVLKTDADWDLAALTVVRPPRAQPLPIAATAAQPGEPLVIAGYGGGDFRAALGRCTQYLAPGAGFPYEMLEVSVEARQGDSGGPILNQRGEIAGVLFGASTGATSGSYAGRVRQFLTAVSQSPAASAPPPASVVAAPPPPDALANSAAPATSPSAQPPSGANAALPAEPTDAEGRLFSTPEPQANDLAAAAPAASGSPSSNPPPEAPAGLIPLPAERSPAALKRPGDSAPARFDDAGEEPLRGAEDSDLGDLTPAPRREPDGEGEGEPSSGLLAAASKPAFGRPSERDPPEGPLSAAEAVRIVHSDLPTRGPAPGGDLHAASSDQLLAAAWRQIGGETFYDQAKTVLALFGLLCLLSRFWSLSSSSESGADAED